MKGPCVVCGDVDYPLSFGGPSICPSCDCGIPAAQKLRAELTQKNIEIMQLKKDLANAEIQRLLHERKE